MTKLTTEETEREVEREKDKIVSLQMIPAMFGWGLLNLFIWGKYSKLHKTQRNKFNNSEVHSERDLYLFSYNKHEHQDNPWGKRIWGDLKYLHNKRKHVS